MSSCRASNANGTWTPDAERPFVPDMFPRHLWVGPGVYDLALFYAAIGRAYATALRRYDRGHPPPMGTWEERLVERDRLEATTPAALPAVPEEAA